MSRILIADGRFDDPKFEGDSSATFGTKPMRRITSAAVIVISQSWSAVGSSLMCVSTRNTWRPGRIRPFIAA